MPFTGTEYLRYAPRSPIAVAVGTKIIAWGSGGLQSIFDTTTNTALSYTAPNNSNRSLGATLLGRAWMVAGGSQGSTSIVEFDTTGVFRSYGQGTGTAISFGDVVAVAGKLALLGPTGSGNSLKLLVVGDGTFTSSSVVSVSSSGGSYGWASTGANGKFIYAEGGTIKVYNCTGTSPTLITTVTETSPVTPSGLAQVIGTKAYWFDSSGRYLEFDHSDYTYTTKALSPAYSGGIINPVAGPDGYIYGFRSGVNGGVIVVNPATGSYRADTIVDRGESGNFVVADNKMWFPSGYPLSY